AISYHLLYLCIIKLSCAVVSFDSSFLVGVHVTHEKDCSMPATQDQPFKKDQILVIA
ncbi:unnamed protein product, partial [Brassica rapa subsp. narinosa]